MAKSALSKYKNIGYQSQTYHTLNDAGKNIQDIQLANSASRQGGVDANLFNTPMNSYYKTKPTPVSSLANTQSTLANTQPAWANPDVQMQQSSFANPEYDKFVANGGNVDTAGGSSFGSGWLYKDVNTMPDNIKNAAPEVQAEWLKSPTVFQSGLSALGTGVSALSGLYGMYNANKNYQLQKQAQEATMAQARASEANRSAMAKAFGSTYIPAQF